MSERRSVPEIPDSSRIQIVESNDDRFVVVLPKGGRNARGMGCFAFFWLLITAAVSIPMFGSLLGFFPNMKWDGDPPPLWLLTLFMSLFWAVGIGMAYGWLKMTFTQTMLSLEPNRFAVQHDLFGKKKLSVLELDASSKAELVEAYSQNDSPVYRIAVTGIGREEKFGTALETMEKEWLVRAINEFLGRDALEQQSESVEPALHPATCPQCSNEMRAIESGGVCDACGYLSDRPLAPLPTARKTYPTFNGVPIEFKERAVPLSPSELPADSKLRVDDSNPDAAKISYVAMPSGPLRYGIAAFLAVFCCAWFGGLTTALGVGIKEVFRNGWAGPQIMFLIIPGVMIVSGLVPLFFLCVVLFGRCVILINGDWVRGRIQAGPFFKEKRIATSSVVDVGLGGSSGTATRVPIRGRSSSTTIARNVAAVFSEQVSLPLSLSGDIVFNRQLAGLVAYQIQQFGHELPRD